MIKEFNKICKTIEDVNMKKYNTFRLETKAKYMCFPSSILELQELLTLIKKNKLKFFVLGNGSNVVLPEYYDGVIIKLEKFNNSKFISENILYVESGYMLNKLANEVTNMGFKGLDFAVGIPGTVGGSIYGNAGCYGSSMSEILIAATVFDGKKIITMSNEDFKFGYRTSILKEKHKNYIILSCQLRVSMGDREELLNQVKERMAKRMASQDLTHPSNGSVFRNPEGLIAGKLIDDMGMKGTRIGDAMVSYKHANFIINDGKATSTDVVKLIKKVKREVKKHYNIDLVLEQEILK